MHCGRWGIGGGGETNFSPKLGKIQSQSPFYSPHPQESPLLHTSEVEIKSFDLKDPGSNLTRNTLLNTKYDQILVVYPAAFQNQYTKSFLIFL